MMESLKVLLQAHQLLSHDMDAQSNFQPDFYSFIYQSSPIDITSRKYRDNSRLVVVLVFKVRLGPYVSSFANFFGWLSVS
jgi:hypothetical protein